MRRAGIESASVEERAGRTPALRLRCAILLALASGCASRPLLERAIRARGGALHSFARQAEADVQTGFPGTWEWRTVFLAPDDYAWSIVTAAGTDHYLFDGRVTRAFIGGREVSVDTGQQTPLRAHARFVSVANLDTVVGNGMPVAPLPVAELPPGVTAGVSVTLPDDGSRYRLGFDERTRLVWATGPVDVPELGRGELSARYDDFRRVGGLWLPFRTTYEINARPLAVERTIRLCPNEPGLEPASFESPDRLPACAGP
jgi:hypothetical protein